MFISASLLQICLCILNVSLCTLPFSSVSSCHYEKLTEIIIGILAFCTMTGVIALDNKESTDVWWDLGKCSHWCITSISSGPLMVSYSLVAIMSRLTKKSKSFLGLLTSSVEILFLCGQGKAKTFLFSLCYLEDRKHLVYILWLFVGSNCPYDTETLQLL